MAVKIRWLCSQGGSKVGLTVVIEMVISNTNPKSFWTVKFA